MASLRTNKAAHNNNTASTSTGLHNNGSSYTNNHRIPSTKRHATNASSQNNNNGISLRVVSWVLMGATAVALGCGFIIFTAWLPEQQSIISEAAAVNSNNKGAADLSASFRNLRHQEQEQSLLWHSRSSRHKPAISTTTNLNNNLDQDGQIQQEILRFLEQSKTINSQTQLKSRPNNSHSPIIQHLQDTWDLPLVHIVNTRFMQEQGHLQSLGRARLYLFQAFCLPSMVHQSTQNFLWIIKTDPNLDPVLLEEMIQTLKPYPNIYLVASNINFMIRDMHGRQPEGHSWRDGAEIKDLLVEDHTIYTGNRTRLYQAMVQKDRQVVLETRLDADDGLHKGYMQQIQDKALEQFVSTQQLETSDKIVPKWLYWCTRRHVEWHGGINERKPAPQLLGASDAAATKSSVDFYGSLKVVEHSKLCITPGITVGFGVGTPANQVPIHAHDKLFQEIHDLDPEDACGYHKSSQCLELVEDFLLVAVRARTPTSAGMQRVDNTNADVVEVAEGGDGDENTNHTKLNAKKHNKQPKQSQLRTFLFWDLLHDDFALLREQIKYTNQYILNHLVPIAKDNLEGQCTSDHSCKEATKEKLMKIIEGQA